MTQLIHSLYRVFAIVLLAAPLVAFAGGDASNGQELVNSKGCSGCHGADGNSSIPTNPILAGQYESYLQQALLQYQSGDRKNAIMGGFAAGLSEQEIADIAAWFASQEGPLQTTASD